MPALVLKVGHYANHHGGLAVTRTLGRAGVPVYGVHEDRLAPSGLSRYAAGRFVWPTAGQHEHTHQLLDGIAAVAERIGRPAVVVPTDDHAAMFVSDHAEALRRWFLLPDQPPGLVRGLTDKAVLHERCVALGVPVPASTVVTTPEELDRATETAELPLMAKRATPWLRADGRRAWSTQVVRNRDELAALDVSSPVVLQEHIPAACSEDWLFHGYCDRSSECLVAFTGRKLRSFPPGAGETSFGRSEPNPILESEAGALFTGLGYRGIMSLDYRYDRRDGRYKLLDFNPRVGAIFRLFETDSGVDVVRAMHLDLTDRRVPAGAPTPGRAVAVEGYDLRAGSPATLLRRLASWRTVDETAWLAADDVLPAVLALGRSGVTRLRQKGRPGATPGPPRFVPGRAARRPPR